MKMYMLAHGKLPDLARWTYSKECPFHFPCFKVGKFAKWLGVKKFYKADFPTCQILQFLALAAFVVQ